MDARPRGEWAQTETRFRLTDAPEVRNARGYPLQPISATLYDTPYGMWVWLDGKAILTNGAVSTRASRGAGFDIDREVGNKLSMAPEWLLDILAAHNPALELRWQGRS